MVSGNSKLVALSLIKAHADIAPYSAVDGFLPFVLQSLLITENPVTVDAVKAAVHSKFGLSLPRSVVKTLLKRASKKGYVKASRRYYEVLRDKIPSDSFPIERGRFLRQAEEAISSFIEFAGTSYNFPISREDAEATLLSFIERNTIAIVNASVRQRDFDPEHPNDRLELLAQRFVLHCHKERTNLFDYIEALAKGNMLATALYFTEDFQPPRKVGRLTIFLDTSIVIHALGLAPRHHHESACELIELCKSVGATVAVFEHTITEVSGVLSSVASALRTSGRYSRPLYGETLLHCLNSSVRASDVEIILDTMEDRIRDMGVSIEQTPPHSIRLSIDEEKLSADLQEEVRYSNDLALEKDVASITAIHRYRKGAPQRRLDDCRAVFVTRNTALARGVRKFFLHEYGRDSISPCVLDYVLATIFWAKNPDAAPSLPRKLVLADCYAVMNPDRQMWVRYMEAVDALLSAGRTSYEDYILLRYSSEAREALLDVVIEANEPICEGTALEVLDRVKSRLIEEEQARAQHERLEAERKIRELESQSEQLRSKERQRRERAEQKAKRLGRLASRIVKYCLASLVWLVLALGFLDLLPEEHKSNTWIGLGLASITSFIIGFLALINLGVGGSLLYYARRAESLCEQRVEELAFRFLWDD